MSQVTAFQYRQISKQYDDLKDHVTFWMNALTATSVLVFLVLLVWLLPGDHTYLLLFSPVPATVGYAYFHMRKRELLALERELRFARTYEE